MSDQGCSWMAEVDDALSQLARDFGAVQNIRFTRFLKIYHLIVLQRRWRLCEIDRSGVRHPAKDISRLINETRTAFRQAMDISFVATNNYLKDKVCSDLEFVCDPVESVNKEMEIGHRELFNTAFPATNDRSCRDSRLEIIKDLMRKSNLVTHIQGKRILEIGCGSCEWLRAYLEMGASHATGIDFGRDTLVVADENLKHEGWGGRYSLIDGTVYAIPIKGKEFDLVGQMGVFHHLADEDAAIKEALRVLKFGGVFVYAAAGKGGIRHALQDKIREIVEMVPIQEMLSILQEMGVAPEQKFHLCDMFKAVYRRTSWDDLIERLLQFGLSDFIRMPNELDSPDIYSKEKYGDGFMKLYCNYFG